MTPDTRVSISIPSKDYIGTAGISADGTHLAFIVSIPMAPSFVMALVDDQPVELRLDISAYSRIHPYMIGHICKP